MTDDPECPFKAGDEVIYEPAAHGQLVNTDLAVLQRGVKYKIARVDKRKYVALEGFENSPGGGIYWTEFSPIA